MIWKESFAACLSDSFVPFLSFRFPISFRTSCGISHSIGSDIMSFAVSWMSSFCFVAVMMKFVSMRIFM